MRRFLSIFPLFALFAVGLASGCGGASGIEAGMPTEIKAPPPGFDPGGDSTPDMSGKQVAPSKKK